MKKITLVVLFFLILSTTKGQNLVPNPSFENYYSCPTGIGQLYICQNWSTYGYAPNYFNVCALDTSVTVPQNGLGFQYAATGNAYCSFINVLFFEQYRQYLGAQLIQPLITGQKYYVSFKVSLSRFDCSSNKMGIRFSTVAFDSLHPPTVNDSAHVWTDSLITDTAGWTQVKGNFIADSNYIHIIIGNFFNNYMYNCLSLSFVSPYYLDDICVSTDSLTCYSTTGINEFGKGSPEFTMYPNPAGDELTIHIPGFQNPEYLKLTIKDILGKEVLKSPITNPKSQIDISLLKKGVYFIEINGVRKKFVKL